ncbi:MAG: hypothetical protein GXP56_10830 [Deltaproteobacteria bacterium]|nr:hypothetical protein [Deltaproteobacteria bacterium]
MKDIHAIRPPVQVGFDPMLIKIALMVLAGAIFLVALFFLIRKWWKKRNRPGDLKYLPEPLAPYEAALKEIDLLFQSKIDDSRLFYFALTAALKKYIGRSFGINAIEMTSQEFIRSLNSLDLDKTIKRDISEFQKISDRFKYAGVVPGKSRVKEDLVFIKEKIIQIEKDLLKLKQKQEEDQ